MPVKVNGFASHRALHCCFDGLFLMYVKLTSTKSTFFYIRHTFLKYICVLDLMIFCYYFPLNYQLFSKLFLKQFYLFYLYKILFPLLISPSVTCKWNVVFTHALLFISMRRIFHALKNVT